MKTERILIVINQMEKEIHLFEFVVVVLHSLGKKKKKKTLPFYIVWKKINASVLHSVGKKIIASTLLLLLLLLHIREQKCFLF